MKRTLIICLLIATATSAQQPAIPDVQRLNAPEIVEVQRQAEEARLIAEAAKARYETAQQRVATVVFKTMADLKLSPKEWAVKQDREGIYLERVKPVETPKAEQK